MKKWYIIAIVAVAVILGIWFLPIVPTDDGVKTLPEAIKTRFGGAGRNARLE